MITAQTTGWAALGRQLQALDTALQTDIMRKAGKKAMQIVQEDMQAHAGYNKQSHAAHLRDNILIRTTQSKKYQGGVMVTVGPAKTHRIKALAQEMGTIKQVPNPFIRPALDYNKRAILTVLAREIRDALDGYNP
ncbi:HK97 gp10 family phage protein [Xenorhabdus budapestensis]|uniref:HK97 gp10 family phage protein n=1 Tax=Xenorhabdus budapestensis TaxID=290110 RepID=A0ABX7VLH0_XENBU|nr:HK97-gp10 family putative phage morphogenesis protein [Xenorhabdus budapestensis]QTL40637.1 HK97 gp10 family phage protein [Xenorhabdus budapestensis]